jgi:hypothetical protein
MNHTGRILLAAFAFVMIGGSGGDGGIAPAMLTLSQSSVMFSAPFGPQNPAVTMVNVSVSGSGVLL